MELGANRGGRAWSPLARAALRFVSAPEAVESLFVPSLPATAALSPPEDDAVAGVADDGADPVPGAVEGVATGAFGTGADATGVETVVGVSGSGGGGTAGGGGRGGGGGSGGGGGRGGGGGGGGTIVVGSDGTVI